MKIEKVKIEDAAELLEIYAPYVKNTAVTFEYDVPTLEEFEGRVKRISSEYPYIKAVKDGKILGYAYANTFKERKAYNWSVETTIYIREDDRRGGVGRALYNALEKSLNRMGVINMNACIGLPIEGDEHSSHDSYKFHQKMGFVLAGRFHNSGFKFNTWYDMVWMEKIIGEYSDNPKNVDFGNWSL
ncbi:MAG: GNAT family N-acetyltransferase [Firmicutes bacterium]|nr:GNAT family N-acetyltransferase [Bacillota bacterium]